MKWAKNLTVFEKNELAIARKTLKMSDVGVLVMGGMTKKEARKIIKRLEEEGEGGLR